MSETAKPKAKKSLFTKILITVLVLSGVAVAGLGVAVFQTLTSPQHNPAAEKVEDSGVETWLPKGASAVMGGQSGEPMVWVPVEAAASQVAVVPKPAKKSVQAASAVQETELLPVNVAEEQPLQPINVPAKPVAVKKSKPPKSDTLKPVAPKSNKPLDVLL